MSVGLIAFAVVLAPVYVLVMAHLITRLREEPDGWDDNGQPVHDKPRVNRVLGRISAAEDLRDANVLDG